jgi:hypothetical protein
MAAKKFENMAAQMVDKKKFEQIVAKMLEQIATKKFDTKKFEKKKLDTVVGSRPRARKVTCTR